MLFSRALLLLSQLALGALAVQSNLAGVIDWHKALVGIPLSDTGRTTSPTFHNFKLANGTDRSSIVLLTESNVVASLSGEDGSIGTLALSQMDVHAFPPSQLLTRCPP
jgi:hypothetical protein